MDNNIYVSYLESLYADKVVTVTLDKIIPRIRSGEFKAQVERIRAESDEEKQRILKLQIPVFFPCLVLNNTENAYCDKTVVNGIIQFDIDTKDNDADLDIKKLRSDLLKLEEIAYLFYSSRKGLKFGIKSDLVHNISDGVDSLKSRFTQAYEIIEAYLHNQLSEFTIKYDDNANHKLACLLSHDSDAYFNPDCNVFKVNEKCIYKKPELRLQSNLPEDASRVEEFLSYIPRDLGYHERLPVNAAVINALGNSALPLLEAHWSTTNRKKLKKDLIDQLRKTGSGSFKPNFGILVNLAKQHGWAPITGTSRNKQVPHVSKEELPPLLSPIDASLKLTAIINAFLADKQSRFINFSTGAGKTYTVLRILEEMSWKIKIIYLVKSHALAEEIRKTFHSIRRERSANRTFAENLSSKSRLTHLKGRRLLCENDSVDKALVPVEFCRGGTDDGESCLYQAECKYTLQFNGIENIRVMTHNEYVNQPAKYFNGITADDEPSNTIWSPDYLIIDEDIFKVEDDACETRNSRFSSVAEIITSVRNGKELKEAIMEHKVAIFLDAVHNNPDPPPNFKINTESISRQEMSAEKYSELFKNITFYAMSEETNYLNGMRVVDDKIIQSVIKTVAPRYRDIPTLFLDATASESIVKKLLPDVEFHSISVKSKDDINLYQLQNKTFTKKQLKQEGVLADVIFGLQKLTEKYTTNGKTVGLITHKTIKDKKINKLLETAGFEDFDAYLANELGIEDFAHFGGLRGLNKLNDVDCLIILGRYCLPPSVIESHTWAIFNEAGGDWRNDSFTYAKSPVRMKDGTVFNHKSQIYINDKKRAVSEHYSLSETQQAIGRGRMIHGKAKDIYYFSKEYLGSDIEVTRFFSYEEFFSRAIIDDKFKIIKADKLAGAIEAGFFDAKQASMTTVLDITVYDLNKYKERIIKEIREAGFNLYEVIYTDKHRNTNKKPYTFYIKDEVLFNNYLINNDKILKSCILQN